VARPLLSPHGRMVCTAARDMHGIAYLLEVSLLVYARLAAILMQSMWRGLFFRLMDAWYARLHGRAMCGCGRTAYVYGHMCIMRIMYVQTIVFLSLTCTDISRSPGHSTPPEATRQGRRALMSMAPYAYIVEDIGATEAEALQRRVACVAALLRRLWKRSFTLSIYLYGGRRTCRR